METFDRLLQITETLMGPDGCPWDRKQTLQSLRPHILEEAHEVLEAVDEDSAEKMVEELGDLLYVIIFFGKIGEKEKRFSLDEITTAICEKLVRRHPHVFGKVKVKDAEEVIKVWNDIKKKEKKERKNLLEGIPKTLSILSRAQKVLEKMSHEEIDFPEKELKPSMEEAIGDQLIDLIIQARMEGVDAECALRRALKKFETIALNH